jgi:hypothetical protein
MVHKSKNQVKGWAEKNVWSYFSAVLACKKQSKIYSFSHNFWHIILTVVKMSWRAV